MVGHIEPTKRPVDEIEYLVPLMVWRSSGSPSHQSYAAMLVSVSFFRAPPGPLILSVLYSLPSSL
jgi:hypothetical protein